MKKRWKIAIGAMVATVILTPVVNYFLTRSDFLWRILWGHAVRQAQQRRIVLLCKTDHQALLEAGREILMHEHVKEKFREGQRVAGNFHVPKGVQIPQAIVDLRPKTVLLDYYGYLIIEMHGGMDHFGVRIYPEGVSEPRPLFHGGRKLLEGLVYYDEGYSFNPEYDKRIDTLIEKNKNK